MPNGEKTVKLLQDRYPDAVVSTGSFRDQHWAQVKIEELQTVCRWLRDDKTMSFEFLIDVTAVHWPDDPEPMEIVYHLYSLSRDDRLRLKVRTGDKGPVPTVTYLWESANWNERETYDMFGIEFEGHPDPRRILMPDDYTDHPLRKELPLYRG